MEKVKERKRRFWNADEKIEIIREHLLKVKLVDTCDEKDIHPTMFSAWLKQVLEAGREALAGTNKKEMRATDRLLSKHQKEIERKNQIIAELTGEILDLKKELGDI